MTLPTGIDIQSGLGLLEEAQWLQKHIEELTSGIFTLIVTGSFNSGKSTLINALMGNETLTMGATPTTAFINRIVVGSTQQAKVVYKTKETLEIEWSTFQQDYRIKKQSNEKENAEYKDPKFEGIDHLEISVPFTVIAHGVEVIDTPGLNEHEQRTRLVLNYLPKAHAIMVVINAGQPFTRDEQEFIKLLGHPPFEHVFFVVNQIDLLKKSNEKEDVKLHTTTKLRKYFLNSQGVLQEKLFRSRLFFTNAVSALEAKSSGQIEDSLYKQSEFHTLEKELLHFLDIKTDKKQPYKVLSTA